MPKWKEESINLLSSKKMHGNGLKIIQADHIIRKSSINLVVFGFAVCTRN